MEAMIDTMNKPQVRQMGKLVDFFLISHTKLTAKTIKLLSKNQEFVKAITENKVPISTKKRIFKQKGGILPMLLPFAAKAAAPLAGSLLSDIAGKLFISNDIWEKVKSNNNNSSLSKKNNKKKKRNHHHPLPSKSQSYKKNKSKKFPLHQNILSDMH